MQLRPTERFSDRVENYRLYRPRYPIEIVDWLFTHCGLQSNATIVDVATGTGLLAEIFLAKGYAVTAVEPNDGMRAVCASLGERFPKLQCIPGTAEATGLPSDSVDLITVGQAMHWFDLPHAHAEFARVLRPGGWCAVVYNERRMSGDALHDGYEHLLREFGIDYETVRHKYLQQERLAEFFGSGNSAAGDMRQATFPNAQSLDLDGLNGRILSSSYMPQPDHPRYPAMLKAIEALFVRCQKNGHVRMEYECVVSCGHLQ
jgi:SAM-dependent methyltransferase